MATSPALSSAASGVPSQTFLQQCEEGLNPQVQSSYENKSTLWKVAAIATLVAFTVLMVGSFIAAGLYAPFFIPILGISSLLLLSQVNKVYHMLSNWSAQASMRAEQLKEINAHHQTLSSATPARLQQILRDKGINHVPGMGFNDPHLTTLKPLIARHMFWEGHVQKLQTQVQEKLNEAAKLSTENYAENQEEIFDLRSEALELENEALASKTKNAFINAVLRRPRFAGNMADLGSFSEISGQERAIAAASNAAGANEFFAFKGATPSIKYSEAKQMSIPDLAMRIVAAMPA